MWPRSALTAPPRCMCQTARASTRLTVTPLPRGSVTCRRARRHRRLMSGAGNGHPERQCCKHPTISSPPCVYMSAPLGRIDASPRQEASGAARRVVQPATTGRNSLRARAHERRTNGPSWTVWRRHRTAESSFHSGVKRHQVTGFGRVGTRLIIPRFRVRIPVGPPVESVVLRPVAGPETPNASIRPARHPITHCATTMARRLSERPVRTVPVGHVVGVTLALTSAGGGDDRRRPGEPARSPPLRRRSRSSPRANAAIAWGCSTSSTSAPPSSWAPTCARTTRPRRACARWPTSSRRKAC